MNDMLDFCLRRGISDVLKNTRTVMQTERKAQLDASGSFVRFGLAKGICQMLGSSPVPQELKLQGNIDGLPLFKSSQIGFRPILCRITNIEASVVYDEHLLWCREAAKPSGVPRSVLERSLS